MWTYFSDFPTYFYTYPTIRYIFNIILQFVSQYGSVQYIQYDIASGLEEDINLTVRIDHPKGVGIVVVNTHCSSVTNVLDSDQYILPSFVLVELNTWYDGDWFQFGLLFSPIRFDCLSGFRRTIGSNMYCSSSRQLIVDINTYFAGLEDSVSTRLVLALCVATRADVL